MTRTSSGQISLRVETANDMQQLAARVGRVAEIGDVIALDGPLGAGKTTFIQGLAQGLGVPAERHVASPTFALVNEHPGRIDFVHVDFYRIRSAAELPELGIEETYDRAVTAIEWADRFPSWLPDDTLHLTLEIEERGRLLGPRPSNGPLHPTRPSTVRQSPPALTRLLRAESTGPRSERLLNVLASPR